MLPGRTRRASATGWPTAATRRSCKPKPVPASTTREKPSW